MEAGDFFALFQDSDDAPTHKQQIRALRRAVISLAQDIQVLKQLLGERQVLEPARYKTLRTACMVSDHSSAGAAAWRRYSYFPHFLPDEEYLRTQLAASEQEIGDYHREVEFVSQLS